ncbi:SRPBCC domain-containing protein [Phyllobacterium sp. YR531]|uniref:SRPBCC domain-containing protein n=1 Tax=Phyllobacterium sp. YR531 TaxID=1144343 RepID=UPI00026FC3DB|nr:SRPBCC domain-containing protein [Phyllobacterium sp. YR531]EJN02389.1 hypothetical protein PMI41_03141 [Phyllobacterium sp. YR531]
MLDKTIAYATVTAERRIRAHVNNVFAAWADKDAIMQWSAPGEAWEMSYDEFDFRTGHTDICTFGVTGTVPYINTVRYEDIRTDERIVYTATISHAGALIFVGTVIITLNDKGHETLLQFTESGFYFDGADTPEGHEAGWEAMLDGLAAYVELKAGATRQMERV